MGKRRLLLILVLRRDCAAVGAEQILLVEDRAAHGAFFQYAHGKICTLRNRETASEPPRFTQLRLSSLTFRWSASAWKG